ncbi:MAG: hypothetical protein NVS9B14_21830 [Candidatus Acidiferrum sp.]
MRSLVCLFLLSLAICPLAKAQYKQPEGGFDAYHGLNAVSCKNPNTAFAIATVKKSLVLCDPAGHAFFLKSFFTFDLNSVIGKDEFGKSYPDYVDEKYGSRQKWADQSIARFLSWGFTGLAPGRNTQVTNPWTTSNPVPFIAGSDIAHYAVYNPQNYPSTCLPKDLMSILATGATNWHGFMRNSASLTDFNSPCWGAFYLAFLNNDDAFAVGTKSAAMKHFLIAISDCDSDNCHGFGAGPDFQPANGNYDFRLGYLSLFLPPTKFADSGGHQAYVDGTIYAKKAFHDLLLSIHTNSDGVNAAIGSSYTTDLTSGTCFGALQPAWLCPSPSPAISLGVGDGSTTTFTATLHGAVSKFSVYIARKDSIVGGDSGTGALFGPGADGLSGSIDYSSGNLTVKFSRPPAKGTPLTAGYIQNGWGIGTGMMDEDCRPKHHSYCGDGGEKATERLAGVNANLQSDVNAMTKLTATAYASQAAAAIAKWASQHGFVGKVLHAGIYTLGSWGACPDKYILQGLAGHQDLIIAAGSGQGFSHWTQPMKNYVHENWGDVPIIESSYRTANRDSSFAWHNSSATHRGVTISATLATPIAFSTDDLIDTFCDDATYNRMQVHPTFVERGSGLVSWNAVHEPRSERTTCTVAFSDRNVGGFASQSARGNDYKSDLISSVSSVYEKSGVHMTVGVIQWAWQDYYNYEKLNWGIVTNKDNPYNGIDDNGPAKFPCQQPDQKFTCGGEAASHTAHGPLGDFISPVGQAHTAVDEYLLRLPHED